MAVSCCSGLGLGVEDTLGSSCSSAYASVSERSTRYRSPQMQMEMGGKEGGERGRERGGEGGKGREASTNRTDMRNDDRVFILHRKPLIRDTHMIMQV